MPVDAVLSVSLMASDTNSCSNLVGALDSNHDVMNNQSRRRFLNYPRADYSALSFFVPVLLSFMKILEPQALQLIPLRSLWNDSMLPHVAHL